MRLRQDSMSEERFRQETTFEDLHDIEKHILHIHSKDVSKFLSPDLLLAVLDEKQHKYVSQQIMLAHEAFHLIKDADMKRYAVTRLLLSAQLEINLSRNKERNPTMNLVLKATPEIEQPQPQDVDQKLIEKLNIDKHKVSR